MSEPWTHDLEIGLGLLWEDKQLENNACSRCKRLLEAKVDKVEKVEEDKKRFKGQEAGPIDLTTDDTDVDTGVDTDVDTDVDTA